MLLATYDNSSPKDEEKENREHCLAQGALVLLQVRLQ